LHAAAISCWVLPIARARTRSLRLDEPRLPAAFATVVARGPRPRAGAVAFVAVVGVLAAVGPGQVFDRRWVQMRGQVTGPAIAGGGLCVVTKSGRGCRVIFDDSGRTSPSSRGRAGLALGHIKTRQTRRLRSPHLGEMLVEHTYVDRPASLETWVDHCTALAAEFGISALDVHRALFAQLPEVFGR